MLLASGRWGGGGFRVPRKIAGPSRCLQVGCGKIPHAGNDSVPGRVLPELSDMRILVVEDEPDLLRTIAQVLREDGYAVDEAADGQEGLYKATSWTYDAIVLDLLMPKLTGWQVLEKLRKTHKTPVLILTARDGVNDRVRGLDGGADDYLAKPFHLVELKARLRSLIRRSAGLATSQIVVGELVVDTKSKTVARGETQILLATGIFAAGTVRHASGRSGEPHSNLRTSV